MNKQHLITFHGTTTEPVTFEASPILRAEDQERPGVCRELSPNISLIKIPLYSIE